MSFGEAVRAAFTGASKWSGRSSRSAFWWFYLFIFVLFVVVRLVGMAITGQSQSLSMVAAVLAAIAVLAVIVPFIGVVVRRLHDQGKSGWWYWVAVIPFIGAVWLLILMALPGTPGPNRFGNASNERA